MAQAIRKTADGFSVGFARLGRRGDGRGSPGQQIYDGDTARVEADGNLGVRLLGVDAPELAFTLPEQAAEAVDRRLGERFVQLTDPRWEEFLSDPFPDGPRLRRELREHLEPRVGPGTAANHAEFARAAKAALRAEVERDLEEVGGDRGSFASSWPSPRRSWTGTDGCSASSTAIRRDRPARPPTTSACSRRATCCPASSGRTSTRFAAGPRSWTPYRARAPGPARGAACGRPRRPRTRARPVAYDDPLRLAPFELRFLGRGAPPDRWLIDVAARDDRLLAPQLYPRVERPEDRLFVGAAYVPLFESAAGGRYGPEAACGPTDAAKKLAHSELSSHGRGASPGSIQSQPWGCGRGEPPRAGRPSMRRHCRCSRDTVGRSWPRRGDTRPRPEDAEDAYQRGLEILLTKAPTTSRGRADPVAQDGGQA